jgi:hypothetical protein
MTDWNIVLLPGRKLRRVPLSYRDSGKFRNGKEQGTRNRNRVRARKIFGGWLANPRIAGH